MSAVIMCDGVIAGENSMVPVKRESSIRDRSSLQEADSVQAARNGNPKRVGEGDVLRPDQLEQPTNTSLSASIDCRSHTTRYRQIDQPELLLFAS